MKTLITTFGLALSTILPVCGQGISVTINGPDRVRPGDPFQVIYSIHLTEDFFVDDRRFADFILLNIEWPGYLDPDHWNSRHAIWLDSAEIISEVPEPFFAYALTGSLTMLETGFAVFDNPDLWNEHSGIASPMSIDVAVTYMTSPQMQERRYMMVLSSITYSTITPVWMNGEFSGTMYEFHDFDWSEVEVYTLNISSVPEPATYAAGIGLIALAAAMFMRRRRRSS